ncbi:MAG: ATP-binding cassette domain-containing protein [Cyclobacteriaceae bacterium]
MNKKLEFDSINLSFGDRSLLSNIYMLCETGRVTGLLGRNGSGKTTLMKIVFGAMAFEKKSVRINSNSLGMDYLRKNFNCLPAPKKFNPRLSIHGKSIFPF